MWRVVPRAALRSAALELAGEIAAKDGALLRLAKEAINGIDPVDVRRSYRFEQGFTFEANLAGVSDQAPGRVRRRAGSAGGDAMSDKRMTADEVVGRLRSGMTVGIGGWGSRRKPMALVARCCGTDVSDLTVVSYGGPDVGLLAAAGRIRKLVTAFVTLDSIPLEPHFRAARERGGLRADGAGRGDVPVGAAAAVHRLPFLPIRAGLGSDVMRVNPGLRTVVSPYEDGEELVAVPALRLDVALVHLNRADAQGNGQYLGPDPYFDDLFCEAAEQAYLSCERSSPTAEF